MRSGRCCVVLMLLLGACARDATPTASNDSEPSNRSAGTTDRVAAGAKWDLQSSGEGVALALGAEGETAAVRLFCPAGARQLIVNVPAFRPIGSEERLSFGSDGGAHALVADPRGDAQRGGVTGTGAVPANLVALVSGQISVSYGAQNSGPHAAPPQDLATAFVAACMEKGAEPAAPEPTTASACLTQDGKSVPANRLRAIGTEPFWGARVEGRCVTYSHPDDQQGTRVWTKFTGTATTGSWAGSLNGSPFELKTRPQAGCSDGMSDNRYPIAVTVTVGGEQRTGCAAPL